MSGDALLDARGVATLLGHDVPWFQRHRKKLEAAGFPKRLAGLGNRWDPLAIRAWRLAQMDPGLRQVLEAARSDGAAAPDDGTLGARLKARAAALAATLS